MRLSALRWLSKPPRVARPDARADLDVLSTPVVPGVASTLTTAGTRRGTAQRDEVPAPSAELALSEMRPVAGRVPTHDPPLAPRDEATFLLHIAAEIEHALMVQYLYAAYSLNPAAAGLTPAQQTQVANWKRTILAIAKEEMAHFISVQNILISLGAPLNFARETYPFRSVFYPFEFKLEALTIKRPKPIVVALKASGKDPAKVAEALFSASLNRYIAAEMPAIDDIPEEDRELVKILTQGEQVNRVGLLFERLLALFDDGPDGGLVDADFDSERVDAQGNEKEWGGRDAGPIAFEPLVRPVRTRVEARALLVEIAEQGEGHETGKVASHFQRFLTIYKELERFKEKQDYLHPVPTNPTTKPPGDGTDGTPITNPRTRAWAQLLNLRYRLLLGYLRHFLSLNEPLFTSDGDRTPHGWLVMATFLEMSHMKSISELLVGLDLHEAGAARAGPPFELPYDLALPDRERDRWRYHIDVLVAARRLVSLLEASRAAAAVAEQAVLSALAERDSVALNELFELCKGNSPSVAAGFAKVRSILDESLRGFPLSGVGHEAFWRVDAADFPSAKPAGLAAIEPGNSANSNLIKALRGEPPFGTDMGAVGGAFRRMPAGRAPVDPSRLAFIERWIDALPGAKPDDLDESGTHPPSGSQSMGRFQEVVDILDSAVGGSASPVGAHGAFWRGKTREEFIAANIFGQMLLMPGDGANSSLVKALRGEAPFGSDVGTLGGLFRRMPAGRPPVPPAQIDVVEKWIDDGCPE
ncbi:ferritin-like domain-containing protein [Ensifer aridi]|uniref:ferritin-like domain-containing protein n=1 Tax=Ensifer aridi TaxID=1708715 RepID=UPI0015E2A2B3|nr:ferritin-like domain-containing protein [Ensifer aridi]